MTGNGLIDFLIGAIVLITVVSIFFIVIPRVSPDPLFTYIAQIVVGVMALIALILAIAGVLGFGGGAHLSVNGMALVTFGIAVIVGLLVLFIVNMVLSWLASAAPPIAPFVAGIKYIIGALVLVALIYIAGTALFSGSVPSMGNWPSGGQHRSSIDAPFRLAGISGSAVAAYSTPTG
jgi:hypothetical protein